MVNSNSKINGEHHYIGIDFGTSNSYCCLTTSGYLSATPVMIDGKTSISTSVLWVKNSDNSQSVIAFGDRAVEEWGFRSSAERKNCWISTMFKPDISYSETARNDAQAFLGSLVNYIREQGILPPDYHSNLDVILGVPAVQAPGFEETLKQIFAALNLGRIRTTPEPVGALINHVATRHDISPGDARRGVLVIDFGGGTCDIAYMFRLEVKTAWGDAMFGGRLFDDLFYQWFLDSNPGVVKLLKKSRDYYYVHWILCKEMKERFSAIMDRDRSARFTHHIHVADSYYGGLNHVSWMEFMNRASNYKPTEYLEKLLKENDETRCRNSSGSYDLIKWFTRVVTDGISKNGLELEKIRYVILTGGSSAWPFVKDTVIDMLQIDRKQLFFSANPMTAVGEGIAILPVIQGLHSQARERIKLERDIKISEIIQRIDHLAAEFASEITEEIVGLIVNEEMRRVLSDFSRNGGSIEDLEQRISETVGKRSGECQNLIQGRENDILSAVNHEVVDVLTLWFRENGMRNWSSDRHYMNNLGVSGPDGRHLKVDDPLLQFVKTITHLVMMYGLGGVLGGSGIALLLPGLPGLVLGAVLGVMFSVIGFKVLKKPLQTAFGKIHIPSWMASKLYSDRRLDKMVMKLREQLHADILSNSRLVFEKRIDELRPVIEEMVDDVVEDLTALDHL
ncbi:hypothetical protein K8T06_04715 [bacterium]|nr:hypothetical protein [bacterium]